MNELLDHRLEVVRLDRTTRQGYAGMIEKHIRPTIGRLPVSRLSAENDRRRAHSVPVTLRSRC